MISALAQSPWLLAWPTSSAGPALAASDRTAVNRVDGVRADSPSRPGQAQQAAAGANNAAATSLPIWPPPADDQRAAVLAAGLSNQGQLNQGQLNQGQLNQGQEPGADSAIAADPDASGSLQAQATSESQTEGSEQAENSSETAVNDADAGAEDSAESADEDGAERQSAVNPELTTEEQAQVEQLQARDAEVRAHEQAHISAAAGYALGGATYSYQTGPDNRRYAVGGEVRLDTSPLRDPSATIAKMSIIRRAALAPAEPSAQDRRVAMSATQKQNQAQVELMELLQAQQQAAQEQAGMVQAGMVQAAGSNFSATA